MQITRKSNWVAAGAMMLGLAFAASVQAEVFTDADLKKYQDEYMASVTRGDDLSHGGIKGNNVACAQCHPNGANMHPETYPKFQKQLGKVSQFYEMVNWCIENLLEGKAMAADSADMIDVVAYNTHERRGVPLAPGKH
ncbi:MAG TPA: cytochrome C [Gammaproteobacteria bacterium]|nr:cytochrome C [Gammaproteobacteria bacterium]